MFYCILQLLAFAIVLGRPTIMQINLKIMILTIVKVIAVIKWSIYLVIVIPLKPVATPHWNLLAC